jgi:hypothetical protein
MREAISALPAGLTEIYTHPATADLWPGSAPGYKYRAELSALTDDNVKAALQRDGIDNGNFSQHTSTP